VREAQPASGYAERDLVCADLDDCMMPAVESVGCCVGTEQGGPGGPKFGTKSSVQPVPQGLKPRILIARLGMAEAVP
jgi:hypothetical protein